MPYDRRLPPRDMDASDKLEEVVALLVIFIAMNVLGWAAYALQQKFGGSILIYTASMSAVFVGVLACVPSGADPG